jgi:hypothetical protein
MNTNGDVRFMICGDGSIGFDLYPVTVFEEE